MTRLIELPQSLPKEIQGEQERARWNCLQLEEGNILFFPSLPFALPAQDIQVLLAQQQSGSRIHKNIGYHPSQDRLTGHAGGDAAQADEFRGVMRRFSQAAVGFAAELLPPYAECWRVDYASFRAQQEKGRQIRAHARNDLLHVDSFPTRPVNGDRILRIFVNLNISEPRVWNTSASFEALAEEFAGSRGMPLPSPLASPRRTAAKVARAVGLGSLARSPYDRWMLRFHHYLKAHEDFQRGAPRQRWEFPPQSTWLVFTDMVSHAVISGQFALEQTFIVSRRSLVNSEKAPVRILERLAGCALTLD